MMQVTQNPDWTVRLDTDIVICVPTGGGEGVAYLLPGRIEIPKEHVVLTETEEAYVLEVK